MEILEMKPNELKVHMLAEINSNVKAKNYSRRCFFKISLIAVSVINSLDNLKADKEELTENTISKEAQVQVKTSKSVDVNSDTGGSPNGRSKPESIESIDKSAPNNSSFMLKNQAKGSSGGGSNCTGGKPKKEWDCTGGKP
ncbi:hypothetical protein JYQ62_29210 [Nostoc sp. UHCC 0702]|nr:hypothetical protein JYQ62_29210 [Nostoc sp. UHCC 0702]